jgi:hypothetical protein
MDNKPGNNPMGGNANYKTAFKTPGYTDFKGGSVVDVAHCKVSPGQPALPPASLLRGVTQCCSQRGMRGASLCQPHLPEALVG